MENQGGILICITAQPNCERIIGEGKKLAQRLHKDYEIVTVQPKQCEAKKRANDMVILEKLATDTDSPIKVIYSNNPLTSLISYAESVDPIHIFTGEQAADSAFVSHLSLLCEAPVTMVAKDGLITMTPDFYYPLADEVKPSGQVAGE